KAVIKQGFIEQLARVITGKGPPGKIRPAQARRQPDNKQFCIFRPEARHRRIEFIGEKLAVGVSKRCKAGAGGAIFIGAGDHEPCLTARPRPVHGDYSAASYWCAPRAPSRPTWSIRS